MGVSTNAHRLCRVLLAFPFELPVWRRRRHSAYDTSTWPAMALHAIRGSIQSGNATSSLPERRIACRFFLFRWHRAHMCHPPKSQDSDLHRPMAWFSSAYVTNGCARPIMGTCARLGSRQARLQHAGLADECALCAFFLCKSCFIRDMDLHRPMAALCAVCLATRRVFGTADSGRHTPG